MVFYRRICHFTGSAPLSRVSDLRDFAAVAVEEFGQFITIHPDLVISLFLGLVENKLKPPVEMYRLDIIDIFFRAVTGVSHIADHVPRRHHAAFFQVFRIRVILPQMGIIIVSAAIEAADTDPPAAVLIPSQRFHDAGFDTYDRRTDLYAKQYIKIAAPLPNAGTAAIFTHSAIKRNRLLRLYISNLSIKSTIVST